MDKRRLKFITWGFVLLTAVIVALMLMAICAVPPSGYARIRRMTRREVKTFNGGALTVVEVRPETVQAAIEAMCTVRRRRSVTVEYLWNSDSVRRK